MSHLFFMTSLSYSCISISPILYIIPTSLFTPILLPLFLNKAPFYNTHILILQVGVPHQVISAKMTLAGLDFNLLQSPNDAYVEK